MNQILLYTLLLGATLSGSVGALYLKKGAGKLKWQMTALLRNWELILGFALYGVGLLLYLFFLKQLPLSIAYPLTSISYVWIALLSKRYLGEDVTRWRWIGILLIIAGITMVAL